jgi:hypothetical protein
MSPLRQTHAGPLRRLAALALVLVFAVFSALPVGVMPVKGSDGTIRVVLCTGDGPVEVTLDARGAVVADDDASAHHGGTDPTDTRMSCDWAGAQHAALHAAPVQLLPVAATLRPAIPAIRAALWQPRPVQHGVQPRAPPSHA